MCSAASSKIETNATSLEMRRAALIIVVELAA
jgi:hypothetical protein